MAARMRTTPWLVLQLVMRRIEVLTLCALIVCLASASLQWLVLPRLEARARSAQDSPIDEPARRSRLDDEGAQTARYGAFRDRLAESDDRSEWLKLIFSEAVAAGIPLSQGDCSLVADANGGYDKLQITLPVKGSYQQIRAFAKALLEKLPALSLDEMSLRRDSIKSPTVEARLRLTLYLKQVR